MPTRYQAAYVFTLTEQLTLKKDKVCFRVCKHLRHKPSSAGHDQDTRTTNYQKISSVSADSKMFQSSFLIKLESLHRQFVLELHLEFSFFPLQSLGRLGAHDTTKLTLRIHEKRTADTIHRVMKPAVAYKDLMTFVSSLSIFHLGRKPIRVYRN